MNYRKRRFTSRNKYNKVVISGRKYGSKKLVTSVKKVIKKMAEVKYATFYHITTYDGNGNASILLNPDIPVGANKNQRIGQKIKYKRLTVRMTISVGKGSIFTGSATQAIRLLIVQSRVRPQSSSSPFFDWADVFDDVNVNSTVKSGNFRVLFDQILDMGINDTTTLASSTPQYILKPAIKRFKISVPVNNNVEFRSSTNDLPNDPADTYYLFAFSGDGAPSLRTTIYVDANARLSYFDM